MTKPGDYIRDETFGHIQGVVISEGMLGRIPAWRVERSDGEVLTIIKGQEVNYDSTTEGRKS